MIREDTTQRAADAPKVAAKRPLRTEQLRRMLRRKSGASIAQLEQTFGWQLHTACAAISTQRKAGHEIVRSNTRNGSLYRILDRGSDQ